MISAHLLGIHHITAIGGDAQKNIDFYGGVLGLRFVKKTVNFDDPNTYHFYFGDEIGRPGTLVTFFPWSANGHRGKRGTGQLSVFAFSIPPTSVGFWLNRLKLHGVSFTGPSQQFGEQIVTAIDHDGSQFSLVAAESDRREGWSDGDIPPEHAIKGIHSVTLSEQEKESAGEFLTSLFGSRLVEERGRRSRFQVGDDHAGSFVDVLHQPGVSRGYMGVGIIHHVAFRTPSRETQLAVRNHLVANLVGVTPVVDRSYFHSIYFSEPGGAVFEVATDSPGFLIDEPRDQLGSHLKLPPQYETYRQELEEALPPVSITELHEVRG